MSTTYRYKAFISYSHDDAATARKLHKKLETYKLPRRLLESGVDAAGDVGIGKFFRDRDEFPAAEDLTTEVKKALTQSQFLIVVCSPAAAASRWVNREIIEFKKLAGERRVLCIILDGDPFASDKGAPELECLPPALRFKLGRNGEITTEKAEPLAADLRTTGDGWRKGVLKLVAGLMDIGLDALIERDMQRNMRRVMAVTAASLVAVLGMGLLTYEAVTARQAAERHRSEAEGLIEFMLTDLRDKLEPVGRLDVLDAVGEQIVSYYGRQPLNEIPVDALGRRARAFHLLGEINDKQGNLSEARQMSEAAFNATKLQLALAPENADRIYEHAQSAYWVGYFDWKLGDYSVAEAHLISYVNLAQRLLKVEPSNTDWRLELAYAHSNLGTLYLRQMKQPHNALEAFQRAWKLFFDLASQAETDTMAQLELTDAHAWLADTHRALGQLEAAMTHRNEEIALYEKLASQDPLNRQVDIGVANARIGRALISADLGRRNEAINGATEAAKALKNLAQADPSNVLWRRYSALAHAHAADILLSYKEVLFAREMLQQLEEIRSGFTKEVEQEAEIKLKIIGKSRFFWAQLAFLEDNIEPASEILANLLSDLKKERPLVDMTDGGTELLVMALNLQAQIFSKQKTKLLAIENWQRVVRILSENHIEISPRSRLILAKAHWRLGTMESALENLETLACTGYQHPDYRIWAAQLDKYLFCNQPPQDRRISQQDKIVCSKSVSTGGLDIYCSFGRQMKTTPISQFLTG